MFEKEAKEYRRIHGITGGCDTVFQDGAEFGYNKANKELQKAKQIIQELLELNYSEFTKTNAVFLHADKFLKESK